MFKADWTQRPAVKVWRDLVKTKWWTREELTSGADGKVVTPGYFGWYDITVERDAIPLGLGECFGGDPW